jgi:electron transfer flavoprotein beta subunit
MIIVVPIKFVPDLVEDLEIDASGAALDRTFLRLIINEFDDHALEQAVLLKERTGGEIVVVAPDVEGAEDMLYTAAAKGADRLVKLTGDFEQGMTNHALARSLATVIQESSPDLILTGVQANDDLDGSLGPLLAEHLDLPYVGYVAGVMVNGDKCVARKEYPGGLVAEMEVSLPAVLGIQAAEQPPRYIVTSLITQAMKTAQVDEIEAGEADNSGAAAIARMSRLEAVAHAEMIEGDPDQVADRLVALVKERGLLPR